MLRCLLFAILLLVPGSPAASDDWRQWRGPDRTDVSSESGLLEEWPDGGPPRVWLYRDAGVGYSGPAIVHDRLYTMGSREDQTYIMCLNAQTGEQYWATAIGEKFTNAWGHGPRSTPTVDGEFVFALSANGDLVCVAAATGAAVWHKSLVSDFGGDIPQWGYCESVLVDGDQIVCSPGGSQGAIVALHKLNGEVIWRSEDCLEPAQYSSIIPVDFQECRLYIQLFMKQLVAVDSKSGDVVWSVDWPGRIAVVPTPIVEDEKVYITAGYGAGCMLVDFSSGRPETVYANKVMKNHHGGVILIDGHLYGHSDSLGWVCQDFATGAGMWREKKELGKGAIGYADGHFYCVDEDSGEVMLVEANAKKWQSRGSFELDPQTELRKPQGRIWTHPVIANGLLYLRDQDLIYCYDVRKK